MQSSVPVPTYIYPELGYFNSINSLRQSLGLGLLAQNTLLDQAARNHAIYASQHGNSTPGIESSIYPQFTGVTAQDRCDHVGYSGTCEQTALWPEISYLGVPSLYVGLLAIEQGEREVGIAVTGCIVITGMACGPTIQLGLASSASPQRQADDFLLVAGLWTSLHVQINEGETLAVSSLQVRDANNAVVAGNILTHATDPYGRVPPHAVVFTPTNGWRCNTQFTVDLVATRNGTPFSASRELTWVCP